MKKYEYMPRITLIPGKYQEDRLNTIVECCKKYEYDDVMFFFNGENVFQGFMTMEELKPYVELVKVAKERLAKEGIKTSVNPWTTLVHCERGRKAKKGLEFDLMVDIDGNTGNVTACPLSENWLNYQLEYFGYLCKELDPNIIWVEDDFRLHNHSPLNWGGCFCEKHMKLYSQEAGREISREELVAGMADNRENGFFRRVYYNVSRRTMRELAQKIGGFMQENYPDVKIGFMSGDPEMHSIEGRDWHGILNAFAGKYQPIDRVHMPMYRQFASQQFCWLFNTISLLSRALMPANTLIYPEVENAKFSRYTKSRNMTRFQAEVGLALCPAGTTMNTDCYCGSGLVDSFGYGPVLKDIKNYFNSFVREEIPFANMNGIIVPVGEDEFLHSSPADSLGAVRNYENYWAGHFSCTGIAFKYSSEKSFKNQIIAVADNWLDGLTDDEVRELFANNFVMLEGLAIKSLFRRNLQSLIRAKSYVEWDAETHEELSIEEAVEGKKYMGIYGARSATTVTCPSFLNIEYEEEPVVYTNILDCREEYMCHSFARFDNCFIMPYMGKGRQHGVIMDLRTEAIKDMLDEISMNFQTPVVYNEEPYFSSYFYETEKADYLLLVNFTDDDYENVRLHGLKKYKNVYSLNRKNGEWEKVTVNENGVWEESFVKATTSALLRLEK